MRLYEIQGCDVSGEPNEKFDFYEEPGFEPLTNLLLEEVSGICREIFEYSDEYEYEITQMWMNCLEPGQSHHIHTHHNTLWSGVFYRNKERWGMSFNIIARGRYEPE